MVNMKWDCLPDKHIVDRYADTVASLGVRLDGEGLDFFIQGQNEVKKERWIDSGEKRFGVFAVGAAHATKQLPLSQAIPMLNHLQLPIILVGGPSDKERGQKIEEETCDHIINACGELNIQETASLVKQSSVVLSPDTGVMHIAAAFKRPLVVFWGNTIEEFGMYPYFGSEKVPYKSVEVKGLSCRPCSKIGYAKCPKGHFKCMRKWNPMRIAEEIQQFTEVSRVKI
jgi:ADP-heptose:LPS heptosyltransferase